MEEFLMKKHAMYRLGRRLPKTAIAWLLALVMVIGLLPASAMTGIAAAPGEGLSITGGKTFGL